MFTIGAALAISFVADRLRPRDGRKPTLVDRWINLDARGDFPHTAQHLDLERGASYEPRQSAMAR